MISRTFTGKTLARGAVPPFAVVVLVVIVTIGLGTGRTPAAEIEETPVEAGESADPSNPANPDSVATETLIPTELPPPLEPTSTLTPVIVPTATMAPVATEPLTGDSVPVPDPSASPPPTADAAAQDGSPPLLRGIAERAAIEIDGCIPTTQVATEDFVQGGNIVYGCQATITVADLPVSLTEVLFEWTVTTDVSPGWTADLRMHPGVEDQWDNVDTWLPGSAPGLVVTQVLTGDDAGSNTSGGVLTYGVRFDLRLTVPECGGPLDPLVTLTSGVATTIDGVPGASVQGQTVQPVRPVLTIAAPSPSLRRGTTGVLDDPSVPLRFSHADQVVDAGTMELTVTSGYCGGWTVSISATDFLAVDDGVTFDAANLSMIAATDGPGLDGQPGTALPLSPVVQSIVSAQGQPIPAGTYTHSFNLTLTIPGGTPPGIYTSTVTVTASAAP